MIDILSFLLKARNKDVEFLNSRCARYARKCAGFEALVIKLILIYLHKEQRFTTSVAQKSGNFDACYPIFLLP